MSSYDEEPQDGGASKKYKAGKRRKEAEKDYDEEKVEKFDSKLRTPGRGRAKSRARSTTPKRSASRKTRSKSKAKSKSRARPEKFRYKSPSKDQAGMSLAMDEERRMDIAFTPVRESIEAMHRRGKRRSNYQTPVRAKSPKTPTPPRQRRAAHMIDNASTPEMMAWIDASDSDDGKTPRPAAPKKRSKSRRRAQSMRRQQTPRRTPSKGRSKSRAPTPKKGRSKSRKRS